MRDMVDATREALIESEQKFRNLSELSPNMIFINKQGRVVYANRKCEEIMGYSRKEFYSQDFNFLTLIAPEYRDQMRSYFSEHTKGKEVPFCEYALITKDGKRIEAILLTKLIKYEGENAILGTVTDITKLKKTEGELRRSEQRYRELANQLPQAVFELDYEGNFLFANQKALEMTGYAWDEFKELKAFQLLIPQDRERAKKNIMKIARGEVSLGNEYTAIRKDGTEFPVLIYSSSSTSRNGKPGIRGILIDITERKE